MEDRGAAEEGGAGGAPLDVRRADSTDAATVQSSAAAGGTKEDDAAAASRGSKTWTCEHCSLENDEPDAEALLLQTGGLVSCVVCLKVRGQDGWICPDCSLMNKLKTNACKVCGYVAFATKRKDGGSRSEAAAIARDYKKRRRVQPKGTRAATPPPTSPTPGPDGNGDGNGDDDDGDDDDGLSSARMELELDEDDASSRKSAAAAVPSVSRNGGESAPVVVEAVRAGQSEVFGLQLRAMHCALCQLGRLPDFRASFA